MHVYIARVLTTDTPPARAWWVWDKKGMVKGGPGETRSAVLARWEMTHGKPTEATRYPGVMRSSEAAMTVGHTRRLPPQPAT